MWTKNTQAVIGKCNYNSKCCKFYYSKSHRKTIHWVPISTKPKWFVQNIKVCGASTRTSLQGLDYFTSDGAKAFDDLIEIADKLGDYCEGGLAWSKDLTRKLKLSKRYFKVDYKVSLKQQHS